MDASHYKHSLRICRSNIHTQHHTSWLLQTKRLHSPARKRDYGTRRCQTLSQRHLRLYCFYLSFNTTDHDCTLWIMYDLGFPTDAIDAVKILYENATTQVKLPSGVCTGQIPVVRGTIQGDTLFLFPISFPSLYGTPPAMAACRKTRLHPHLHP